MNRYDGETAITLCVLAGLCVAVGVVLGGPMGLGLIVGGLFNVLLAYCVAYDKF